MTTTKGIPRVLILGDAGEGSFEKELKEFLSSRDRAQVEVESKSSPRLTQEAGESDLILMCFAGSPDDEREVNLRVLPYLRDKEKDLLLFAKDNTDLYEVFDQVDISPGRVFRASGTGDWQKRLLDTILQWVREEQERAEKEAEVAQALASKAEPARPEEKKEESLVRSVLDYLTANKQYSWGGLATAFTGIFAVVTQSWGEETTPTDTKSENQVETVLETHLSGTTWSLQSSLAPNLDDFRIEEESSSLRFTQGGQVFLDLILEPGADIHLTGLVDYAGSTVTLHEEDGAATSPGAEAGSEGGELRSDRTKLLDKLTGARLPLVSNETTGGLELSASGNSFVWTAPAPPGG